MKHVLGITTNNVDMPDGGAIYIQAFRGRDGAPVRLWLCWCGRAFVQGTEVRDVPCGMGRQCGMKCSMQFFVEG